LTYVSQGKDVLVARTFSKIWGMAGLRCGFLCARPELIARLSPFRNNIISYPTTRAVLAALAEAERVLPERRARYLRTRRELCEWLTAHNVPFIESHANFVMIEVGRDALGLIGAMTRQGVAVGRPFPPLTNMVRVSIGSDRDMARFREVFWTVYQG
jgi:histidinol-phosphate/aromatic aminotransferase/cobyric acid decarboxylase-like protein